MSLFQDDFYSTKVSRWGRRGGQGANRDGNRLFWIIVGSVVLGVALTLLLLALVGGVGGFGGEDSPRGSSMAANGQEDRIVQVTAKVRPTVVSVISTFKNGESDPSAGQGIGSGVIFGKTGGKAQIVTNNHVVEGASSYEVIMTDGERKKAEAVGMDRITDLAVLEIDASGVKDVAEFGDSDRLQPGEWAISIGNPLGLNVAQTVTLGIISSPKVTIPVFYGKDGETEWEMDVIQTDAAINRGNSGGALVSMDGKVIGINSRKVSDTGVEGLGFAIPINTAKPVIEALIRDHKMLRAFIGVTTQDLGGFSGALEVLKLPSDVKQGAVVLEATGPAKAAGLRTNDVIVELDDHEIDGTMALRKYLYNEKKIGDKLKIIYYRNGKKASVTLVLDELKG